MRRRLLPALKELRAPEVRLDRRAQLVLRASEVMPELRALKAPQALKAFKAPKVFEA